MTYAIARRRNRAGAKVTLLGPAIGEPLPEADGVGALPRVRKGRAIPASPGPRGHRGPRACASAARCS